MSQDAESDTILALSYFSPHLGIAIMSARGVLTTSRIRATRNATRRNAIPRRLRELATHYHVTLAIPECAALGDTWLGDAGVGWFPVSLTEAGAYLLGRKASHQEVYAAVLGMEPRLRAKATEPTTGALPEIENWRTVPLRSVAIALAVLKAMGCASPRNTIISNHQSHLCNTATMRQPTGY